MFDIAETLRALHADSAHCKHIPTDPTPLPQFRNLALHQCPLLHPMLAEVSSWTWGRHVFLAATRGWEEIGLWPSVDSMNIQELSLGQTDSWTCFEDIFFDMSYGSWLPAPQHQTSWRNALLIGLSPLPTPSNHDSNSGTVGTMTLQERCRHGAVRIAILQRRSGSALRRFQNLKEVRSMLGNYTSLPVNVVIADADTSIRDQARFFADGFNLLITPHGSQLANMIFCNPNHTAVIEVLPVVYDPVFETNAKGMGLIYHTSTGHQALCDDCEQLVKERCLQDPSNEVWACKEFGVRLKLLQSDMIVDLRVLKRDVERTLAALCDFHAGRRLVALREISRRRSIDSKYQARSTSAFLQRGEG